MKRRGLIAMAAAIATGMAVEASASRVGATTGQPVTIGNSSAPTNASDLPTRIYGPSTTDLSPVLFKIDNYTSTLLSPPVNTRFGIVGSVSGVDIALAGRVGVYGAVDLGNGVQGATAGTGNGVYGNGGAGTGIGVYGTGTGNHAVSGNLFGTTANTAGVFGSGNDTQTYGVIGSNIGAGGGVFGTSTGTGTGVFGTSATGIGVYGTSSGGSVHPYGVVGQVTGAPGFSVYGFTSVSNAVAVAGGTGVADAIAGQFSGAVNVYGSLTVLGAGNAFVVGPGATKNAAVQVADGSHRLMHSVEAPEPWFEDFGEGTINGGKAEVVLDPVFASTIDTRTLHAFFVSHDATHALHLAGKSATGFTVGVSPSAAGVAAGKKAGDLNGTFTWRVVGKRKDVSGERLAKFTPRAEIKAAVPAVPKQATFTKGAPPPPITPMPVTTKS